MKTLQSTPDLLRATCSPILSATRTVCIRRSLEASDLRGEFAPSCRERWLVGLATVLLATIHVVASDASADVQSKPSAVRPNILFAIADDASFAHFGAYGCRWVNTPAFDRIAREGLLFERAYTPNAKCAPSRAAILTGRYSWQLAAAANHWCYFPTQFTSFPEVLAHHGYRVGMTGKGWAPGIALNASGQSRQLIGRPYQQHRVIPPTPAIATTDYAANFAAFLAEDPSTNVEREPWFFWYGGLEPHRSYQLGSGQRLGNKTLDQIDQVPSCWPDNQTVRGDLLDYAYELEYFDAQLLKMLELLEDRGELDNTLVVVTADNGMPFPRVKGQCYELSNHLPLAMMWPQQISGGHRVEEFVSFVDLAPTFLELAQIDVEQTPMAKIAGISLAELLSSPRRATRPSSTKRRDHALIGKERHDVGRPDDVGYPVRGIVTDGWLYVRNYASDRWPAGDPVTGYLNCDGSPTKSWLITHRTDPSFFELWQAAFGKRPEEELYDLRTDPECMRNLADKDSYQATRTRLRSQMETELRQQRDPRVLGNGYVFDSYPYADSATQQFYNRFRSGEQLKAGWVSPSDFDEE